MKSFAYLMTSLLQIENITNLFYPMKGVLDNAGFPAVVTAHFVPVEGQLRPRTTILIKFADEVPLLLIPTLHFCSLCHIGTVDESSPPFQIIF